MHWTSLTADLTEVPDHGESQHHGRAGQLSPAQDGRQWDHGRRLTRAHSFCHAPITKGYSGVNDERNSPMLPEPGAYDLDRHLYPVTPGL
jgi:hypothetical protein